MKLRIIDIIRFFEEDFKFNIKSSFADAAIESEAKELEKQHKKQAVKQQDLANNQVNLSAKVQNIRETYVPKANFYPFQAGVVKKESKPTIQ